MKLIVSFLLVSFVQAYVEWPFTSDGNGGALAQIGIGTPVQTITFNLTFYGYCPGLIICNRKTCQNGFNNDSSSTFHEVGEIWDDSGIEAKDDFVITASDGTPQKLQQKYFNFMTFGGCIDQAGTLSLASNFSGWPNDFLSTVLKDYADKVIVFTLDNVVQNGLSTGSLFVGGRPSKCSSSWTMFPEDPEDAYSPSDPQWNFQLDRFEVGKFALTQPGKARITIENVNFALPPDYYDTFVNILGGYEDSVPCSTTKTIDFTVNGYKVSLTSDQYLDKSSESGGYCKFLGYKGTDNKVFTLPSSVLGNHCLLLDFQNNQLGLAYKD